MRNSASKPSLLAAALRAEFSNFVETRYWGSFFQVQIVGFPVCLIPSSNVEPGRRVLIDN